MNIYEDPNRDAEVAALAEALRQAEADILTLHPAGTPLSHAPLFLADRLEANGWSLARAASEPGLREAVEHALEFVAYDVPDDPADPMAAVRHARKLARAALEANGWTLAAPSRCMHLTQGVCDECATLAPAASEPGGAADLWTRLANDIRAVDGNHDLGAGELAHRLVERGWTLVPAASEQPKMHPCPGVGCVVCEVLDEPAFAPAASERERIRDRLQALRRHACEPCEPDPEGWMLDRDDVFRALNNA